MILQKIIDSKKLQLEQEMSRISVEGWKQRLKRPGLHAAQSLYDALKKNNRISIIGEIKKASPSKGIIREDFDVLKIAREYGNADVQAVSVLTEKHFFLGEDDYLSRVRQVLPVPLLRKDFIIDIWQIYQSRVLGADAILLIAAVLDDEQLKKFRLIAGILGMQCLVEVHDINEVERALSSGARIIGINNRDLKTFEVDLAATGRLVNHIPRDRAVVSESGIRTPEDMKYLSELGVDGVLIGETLMRAPSIAGELQRLRAV